MTARYLSMTAGHLTECAGLQAMSSNEETRKGRALLVGSASVAEQPETVSNWK